MLQDFSHLIDQRLVAIERSEGVRILFACEAGSRAWGFPSKDSDYDVRFIYLHPYDWYISIDLPEKRDVIELSDNERLDMVGWDLPKTLRLFRKSNPRLIEWLGSPIIYMEHLGFISQFRKLVPTFLSKQSCRHFYLREAEKRWKIFSKGSGNDLKSYFYCLYAILALKWLERDLGAVPTEFERLLEAASPGKSFSRMVSDLIRHKSKMIKSECLPVEEPLRHFVATELLQQSSSLQSTKKMLPSVDPLNNLFRNVLREVWAEEAKVHKNHGTTSC